jgi:hypothetical protein
MPKKLDSCVSKLIEKGTPEKSAWAICRRSMDMCEQGEAEEVMMSRAEEMAEKEKQYSMDTFDLAGIEVFAAGTWNGDKYSVKDLDDMVAAFAETKEKIKPFVKIGHGDEQGLLRSDEMPAAGWVTDLYRSGNKLLANFSKVPKKIYDLIRAGAYRTVSSEIYWDIEVLGKKFRRMLKAVALLGSEMPAVTDLNDIMSLYSLDGNGYGFAGLEPKTYAIKKNDLAKENHMDELEKLKAALAESDKKYAEATAQLKEAQAKLVKAEAEGNANSERIKHLSSEMESLRLESKKANINARIDKLIVDGKVLPAQRADLFSILMGGGTEKKYSVGEKQYESMEEAMFAFIGAGPKIAPPTEEGTQIGRKESNDLNSKAKEYAEKHKVSLKDAMIVISRETGQAA